MAEMLELFMDSSDGERSLLKGKGGGGWGGW